MSRLADGLMAEAAASDDVTDADSAREFLQRRLKLADAPSQWSGARWGGLVAGHVIGEPAPLFPRRDTPAKPA